MMVILSRVMSPRHLQVKKIPEVTSISLEQHGELQGLEVCSEEVIKAQGHFHRHGLDWDWIHWGSEPRHSTEPQEPEDHSAELLRRLLAGNRETDISRVKLAKMPAPTGSRGLPPAKAWQNWFTIRLRTWANVISPEFEAELLKKAGSAGRSVTSRCSGQTARARDLLQHRRQDVTIPAWCRLVVRLRDPESIAQRNFCQHGRPHGSASREVCQARPLQGQDEAVVDAETVAYRPQGVAGGRKLAIQRDSDAILEDVDGRNQRPQQRARNHRFACTE